MQGDIQKFSQVLQQFQQNHPNDPQLEQLKFAIVTAPQFKRVK